MKKLYIFLLGTFLSLNIIELNAQQVPLFGDIYSNPYIETPAMVGNPLYTQAFLHYRKQWEGMPGAPESLFFTLDKSMGADKTGLGLKLYNDKTNLIQSSGIFLSYRYKVRLGNKHHIRFGLSGGLTQHAIDFQKLNAQNPNEKSLLQYAEKTNKPNANFGIRYELLDFHVDAVAYNILYPKFDYTSNTGNENTAFSDMPHFLIALGYEKRVHRDIKLFPSIYTRSVQGMPLQYGARMYTMYKDFLCLGLHYNQQQDFGASLSFFFHQNISVSYAHYLAGGTMGALTNGSHEITIGYKFRSNSKSKVPYTRHSKASRKNVKQLMQIMDQQSQQIDRLRSENENLKELIKESMQEMDQQTKEIEELRKIYQKDKQDLESEKLRYEVKIEDIEKIERKEENLHKFKIIVAAYKKVDDAKIFQKILERELNLSTQLFVREDGKFVFVSTGSYTNKKEIVKQMKALRKKNIEDYIDGNVWVYQAQ